MDHLITASFAKKGVAIGRVYDFGIDAHYDMMTKGDLFELTAAEVSRRPEHAIEGLLVQAVAPGGKLWTQ